MFAFLSLRNASINLSIEFPILQSYIITLVISVSQIVDLINNKIEQIKKILLKVIEMLKTNLKENVENSSKLIRTLNRIENKFQIIKRQNTNQFFFFFIKCMQSKRL